MVHQPMSGRLQPTKCFGGKKIKGFLSFREYPALLAAWEMLSQKPDLVFVDGHGISHPRRLGVASHFGLLVDVPTIGPDTVLK